MALQLYWHYSIFFSYIVSIQVKIHLFANTGLTCFLNDKNLINKLNIIESITGIKQKCN